MKKILTFLAVAIVATASVKASTVSWFVESSDLAGCGNVLVYAGDISSLITSWGDKSLTIEEISASVGTGSAPSISESYPDEGMFVGSYDNSSMPSTVSFVVFDTVADGNSFFYATGVSTDGYVYTPPANSPGDIEISSFTAGTFAAKSEGGDEAIPEPCSVALIALGLAAFGLRRKVQA